ncbi:riboflavin kinase-like [Pollicipes pollicipes]|uniref:riboflavin kinase-like n=1 Tax=Pollicipes pollicipes TaxID=41117 RepID=UPI001885524E|nr:riboflavin kinase-like [Pollicipes pollicipes]XP_037069157.1 riboflavin kinase-like [Pollicipes pollicipes]XP_037069158.1 riboflavin kinase-like [Pollicipes pollicipes]XP_037069159.1 riboflavin kinase-like [Pollicipes pollicipes]XP_037086116.1 riboflavin kinase-like [Pollicipes pollicipes]XP_037086117.1 riboflavin kinase-like [Pollicipes pollicipes]XP_037086118.1 riboflavin kinase-like [Pollicipes pollicipes]XP_037086119.1 riboflavin kinase-like [Pollicipes pollicipes]XP_037086120.1 ribo
MTIKGLPFFAAGKVVKGFGRGSKQLGIPTANFPENVVDGLPSSVGAGVYFGYARVDDGPVHNMVMSIGWNPFYKNEKKSMETHIMHKFTGDFYGSTLRVCMVGFIRPEKNFKSLDELIRAINDDIDVAAELCARPENAALAKDDFFFQSLASTSSGETSDRTTSPEESVIVRSDSEGSIEH